MENRNSNKSHIRHYSPNITDHAFNVFGILKVKKVQNSYHITCHTLHITQHTSYITIDTFIISVDTSQIFPFWNMTVRKV